MMFSDLGALQSWLMTLLFCAGLVLIAATIWYSVRHYRKPLGPNGEPAEHAEPGVPVVLVALIFSIFVWLVILSYLVATTGVRI